jgi:quercetin dioxygenase-like cupin family protein
MSKRPQRLTTTGGSDEREARTLIAPLLGFNLAKEASRLRAESEYIGGDRNARTLVKAGAFRLVLLAFRSGAAFDEADQRGTVALQVLEGRLVLCLGRDQMEVGEDGVAVVPADHPWAAVATTDSLILLATGAGIGRRLNGRVSQPVHVNRGTGSGSWFMVLTRRGKRHERSQRPRSTVRRDERPSKGLEPRHSDLPRPRC